MASLVSLTQSVRALQQMVNALVQSVHDQDQRIGRLETTTNVTEDVVARMVASALAEAEEARVPTDPVEDALSTAPPPVPALAASSDPTATATTTTAATGRARGRPKSARSTTSSTVLDV